MRDMSQVLECWAGWARSERSGVDYPPIAAGFRNLIPQVSKLKLSCSDSDGLIIDGCLSLLRSKRLDEFELLMLHYFYDVSKRKLAQKNKCDEKVIRIKIQMAEGFIEGCLSMLDVKLDMD